MSVKTQYAPGGDPDMAVPGPIRVVPFHRVLVGWALVLGPIAAIAWVVFG